MGPQPTRIPELDRQRREAARARGLLVLHATPCATDPVRAKLAPERRLAAESFLEAAHVIVILIEARAGLESRGHA